MARTRRALLIIDVQNDFCPGGALAVASGDAIVPVINRITGRFDTVVATQDWHPNNHVSFASNHPGKKPFDTVSLGKIEQVLWPDHCVQGTSGAAFHPDLNTDPVHLIVRKGFNPAIDSYSAFMENDKKTITGLAGYLTSLKVRDLYLCGLATDFCVFYSAMDAVAFGFRVFLVLDACKGIDVPAGTVESAVSAMKSKGVTAITAAEV